MNRNVFQVTANVLNNGHRRIVFIVYNNVQMIVRIVHGRSRGQAFLQCRIFATNAQNNICKGTFSVINQWRLAVRREAIGKQQDVDDLHGRKCEEGSAKDYRCCNHKFVSKKCCCGVKLENRGGYLPCPFHRQTVMLATKIW